ncbi:MAG: Hpt domain-containing protein [bacterium]
MKTFEGMIPGLADRCHVFLVDTSELDDELVLLFRDHINNLVLSIHTAVTGRSEPDVRRAAHSLLGMGGTMGVPALSVVAEELSAGIKRGDYSRCFELSEGLRNWVAAWSEEGISES